MTKQRFTISGIPIRPSRLVVIMVAITTWSALVRSEEAPFAPDQNAYNPIPSPDGTNVAFVQTGWGRPGGSGGFGRSNLCSYVTVSDKHGNLLTGKPLADAFLAGWTPDGEALVCYRDWRFFLVSLDGAKSQAGQIPAQESRPERVQYHPTMRCFLWLERDYGQGVVRADDGKVLARHENMLSPRYFALSNDGKWLATVSRNHLVVLDLVAERWSDLGPITTHPQPDWDYIKPSWNPWFRESTHLAFVSEGSVVITTPNGKQKRTLCRLPARGGIAAPSPDGKQVAYVTFKKRPREGRRDLAFWGDARVWVVSVMKPNKPKAVTAKNLDSIYCLRWLNEEEVIFDRLADRPFFVHARLWRAVVPHQDVRESNKVYPPDR